MYAASAATRFFTRNCREPRCDSPVAGGSLVPLDVPCHGTIGTTRGEGTLLVAPERRPWGGGVPVCGPLAARDGRAFPDLHARVLCGCAGRVALGTETERCS